MFVGTAGTDDPLTGQVGVAQISRTAKFPSAAARRSAPFELTGTLP